MADIESFLSILRIDWEETLSHDFNPLPLALQLNTVNSSRTDNYRNMYHKVEKAMTETIESSFKGYSESIISYKECLNDTNMSMEYLFDIENKIEEINKSCNIDIEEIKTQRKIISQRKDEIYRFKTCVDFKNMLNEGNFATAEDAAYNIISCLEYYKELEDIKAVKIQLPEIDKKRARVTENITNNILDFIFKDLSQINFDVRSMFVLELYVKLDKHLSPLSKQKLITALQGIIYDVKEYDMCDKEKSRILARALNAYLNTIIKKFDEVLQKVNKNKGSKKNFFEKSYNPSGFFNRSIFIGILKKEVMKIIECYTMHVRNNVDSVFNLEYIEDFGIFDEILDKNMKFDFQEKNNNINLNTTKNYEVITESGYDFVFCLYEGIFVDIKKEIHQLLRKRYFIKKEKSLVENINGIFDQRFTKIENKNSAIYSRLEDMIVENDYYGMDFGLGNFISIYNTIIDELDARYSSIYHSRFFDVLFGNMPEFNNCYDLSAFIITNKVIFEESLKNFKALLLKRKIEVEDCFTSDKNYRVALSINNTIKNLVKLFYQYRSKYEKIEISSKLTKIESSVKTILFEYTYSFTLQCIINILFIFDRFLKSGKFGDSDASLQEITRILQMLFDLNFEINLHGLFDCIEYYLLSNVELLNVQNKDDVIRLCDDLRMLEEIICNFEMRYDKGFESMLLFLEDVVNGGSDTPDKIRLQQRISKNE